MTEGGQDGSSITTAMVLAAGRGERLRPITDRIPKPLVELGGQSLLQRHLLRLKNSGISRVVINIAHLAQKIIDAVEAMSLDGMEILFSKEVGGALETAGGIVQALPMLNAQRFLVVNADVWTDFDFSPLLKHSMHDCLAHLVMVDVPEEKQQGDFYLDMNGRLNNRASGRALTFSGISVMSSELFAGIPPGRQALRPVLDAEIVNDRVSAEHFTGQWYDVGTPERLSYLRQRLDLKS